MSIEITVEYGNQCAAYEDQFESVRQRAVSETGGAGSFRRVTGDMRWTGHCSRCRMREV